MLTRLMRSFRPTSKTTAAQSALEAYLPPIRPHFFSEFGGLWIDLSTAKDILQGKLDLQLVTQEEADRLEHWIDWGYVILPQGVREDKIDALLADIEKTLTGAMPPRKVSYWDGGDKYYEDGDREKMTKDEAKLLDLHWTSVAAREVIFSEPVERFLQLIFERPAVSFQSLTFLYGSQQPVHQDTAFVLVDSPLEFAASWVALEDIQPGAGELVYYPGSHKLTEVLFHGRSKWVPPGTTELKDYSQKLHQRSTEAGLELKHFCPKKGDVLLWSADLVHGGAKRRDPIATRKSIVTHYCPLGRKPMYALELPDFVPSAHSSTDFYWVRLF